jgi:hypothetical protein
MSVPLPAIVGLQTLKNMIVIVTIRPNNDDNFISR